GVEASLTRGPITHKLTGDLPNVDSGQDPADAPANNLDAAALGTGVEASLTRGPITHKLTDDLPSADAGKDSVETPATSQDGFEATSRGKDQTETPSIPSSRFGRLRKVLGVRGKKDKDKKK
ncbi:MAG: hypothetical protein AAGA10_09130, partial [Bacteroidota bacterium]